MIQRELEASVDRMSVDKQNELHRKLDACDMEDEETSAGQEAQVTVSTEDGETGVVKILFKCYLNMHRSV